MRHRCEAHIHSFEKEMLMLTFRSLLLLIAMSAMAGILVVGCSRRPAANPSAGPTPSQVGTSGDEKISEGLSQLSEADHAAALAQRVCPVSEQELGSMGTPPKVIVNGQEVFLCCGGCEAELRKEPAKYLAKLKSE
jgi:hypothetical protein